jgi:hypothetical protein
MNRRALLQSLLASLVAPEVLGSSRGAMAGDLLKTAGTSLPAIETCTVASDPRSAGYVDGGFHALDGLLGELHDGALVAIPRPPRMGKTSLALAAAAHLAVRLRQPVVVFSAPLQEQEVRAQMIALLAGAKSRPAKSIFGSPDTSATTLATQGLASAPLLIDDRHFLNREDLVTKVVWNNIQSHLRNRLTAVLAPELLEVAPACSRHRPGWSLVAEVLRELGSICGGAVLCELPLGRAFDAWDNHCPASRVAWP